MGGCRLGVLLCTELKCKTHYVYVECLFCRAVAAADIYIYLYNCAAAAVVGTAKTAKIRDHATASIGFFFFVQENSDNILLL